MTQFFNTLSKSNQAKYNFKSDIKHWKAGNQILNFSSDKSYIFRGVYGSGKTTLTLQLAKDWLQNVKIKFKDQTIDFDWYVRFIHFADLCDLIIDAQFDKPFKREELRVLREEVRFLIIDDFGAGTASDFRLPYLERFFDERCQPNMITNFTTNTNLKDWDSKFDACRSRIIEIVGVNNNFDLGTQDCRIRTEGIGQCNFNFEFTKNSTAKPSLEPDSNVSNIVRENPMVHTRTQWERLQNQCKQQNKILVFDPTELKFAENKWKLELSKLELQN